MPIANINGVNLNYEVDGQGNAVLLVHGYTGSSQDWVNQVPVLSLHYKVIALDLRGHGKSAAPSGEDAYSVKILANDVFSLLKMLDVKQCCLVGHSLGGFVALQVAPAKEHDVIANSQLVFCAFDRLECIIHRLTFPFSPDVEAHRDRLILLVALVNARRHTSGHPAILVVIVGYVWHCFTSTRQFAIVSHCAK